VLGRVVAARLGRALEVGDVRVRVDVVRGVDRVVVPLELVEGLGEYEGRLGRDVLARELVERDPLERELLARDLVGRDGLWRTGAERDGRCTVRVGVERLAELWLLPCWA